jgi:hypothetical protein
MVKQQMGIIHEPHFHCYPGATNDSGQTTSGTGLAIICVKNNSSRESGDTIGLIGVLVMR